MNIIIVNDHAALVGGVAMVAIQSAIGLARRGHRVIYFAATGPVAPELAASGVEVLCLGQPDINTASSPIAFTRIATWNRPARAKLSELLGGFDQRDTVVHLHSWAKVLSPSIGRAIVERRANLVATLHDFFWVCPNGGFFVYPKGETCHRTPQSFDCISTNCDQRSHARKLWRSGRHWLLDHASGLKDACRHIITLSATQERVARPWLPAQMKVHRVDNPIDIVDRGPKPAADLGPFLFVGRLSPEKGARLFCEAGRRIGVSVRIVGDGPLREELQHDFPEHVFAGWKNTAEVTEEIRAARALVFPSVLYEGQPLTVYEALANGCPVIASDAGAAVEAIVERRNGLCFKSANVDSLVAAMRQLQDDDRVRAMAAGAYDAYWRAPLTLDRHLDGIENVYRAAMMAEAGIAA
ncbi:glycosyltransferase family 4 protein [Terrarubrum flagellatum]|uniref:glycosyltransferase family 4 protein n=1 Tax=Terrirubrum flagellatum TaxID=2895980 RepID=UPI0031454676